MDTYMTIDAYGDNSNAVGQAEKRVSELEKLFSVTDEHSEIYALNHGYSGELSRETIDLIRFALEMSEKTDGALDPTIYPVLVQWGFTTGEYRIPEPDILFELLKNTGRDKVHQSGDKITLEKGAMLDLGAVAKGYASEECAEIMHENGIKSALINLGGNIRVVGNRPDGSPWKIGIANPLNVDEYAGILSLSDNAAVTSGNYQRFFIEDDIEYGHIINPEIGIPVDNDLLSVTVIAKDGTLCDALSTALFVMGAEKAEGFWRGSRDFEAVFIAKDKTIRVTSGIIDNFKLDENSGFTLKEIKP